MPISRIVVITFAVLLSLTPAYAVIPPPILDSLRAGGKTIGGPGGCEHSSCAIYEVILAGTEVDACVTVRNIADPGFAGCKVTILSGGQEIDRAVGPGKTRTVCADAVEGILLRSFGRDTCRAIWRVDMK